MSDLDLPRKPRPAINLDSDGDDGIGLPPPRKPPVKPSVVLDDDDDDDDFDILPAKPATAAPAKKAPPPTAVAGSKSLPISTAASGATSAAVTASPPVKSGLTTSGPGSPSGKHTDPLPLGSPVESGIKGKVPPAKVYKEGFLLKQQPSWPYSNQKRYCVIKNCRLFYFDSQESVKQGKPQGVVELANAKMVDPGNDAKLPNSFGIRVASEPGATSDSASKKARTFIFSVIHAHELGEWKAAICAIVGNDDDANDVHWFEKLVQGVY